VNFLSFPCSEKSLSIPGLWPPCMCTRTFYHIMQHLCIINVSLVNKSYKMLHMSNVQPATMKHKSGCNILNKLNDMINENLHHTSTSCGANKVASLTADGIVSSMLNAGKLETTFTSGITLYRSSQKVNNKTCMIVINQTTTVSCVETYFLAIFGKSDQIFSRIWQIQQNCSAHGLSAAKTNQISLDLSSNV